MRMTSNMKGQIAQSKAELRSLEKGYIPSRPIYDNRYDLIVDTSKKLLKLQVKYADGKPSNSDGSVMVKLAYEDRQKKVYTYQKHEVDGLLVYIPKIDKVCFFKTNMFAGKRNLCIRIGQAKNNQKKGVILAKDYLW